MDFQGSGTRKGQTDHKKLKRWFRKKSKQQSNIPILGIFTVVVYIR